MNNILNKETYKFLMSQLRLQKLHGKGRRFDLEDKIFAISLLKLGPRAYRILRRIFVLPSRQTLNKLLQRIPFKTGLSLPVFKKLTKSVKKMKDTDKLCSVLMDEMSLDVNLQYDPVSDSVSGFEDIGDERRSKFADHALVFMVTGLCRKWKQPLAYYFTSGGFKKDELAAILKKVILALQDTGLKVVCAISDQLSTNAAVFKILKDQTTLQYKRETGEEYRGFGFMVGGEEIIPLFDPPHLLKGLRNHFLNSERAQFEINGLQYTAHWNDLVALYEADVNDSECRVCPRLTLAHIQDPPMNKMKVKLAAQVFFRTSRSYFKEIYPLK
ncbi:hypothetical protein ABEB36_007860 [Hypothenemus hampei]|uniref:Transposable element P transposase n=1 Tax=Hypothenemus hampei TaxID=57062 RepID=A0ABD1EZA3_HYPHA